jgi:hypothetical protein
MTMFILPALLAFLGLLAAMTTVIIKTDSTLPGNISSWGAVLSISLTTFALGHASRLSKDRKQTKTRKRKKNEGRGNGNKKSAGRGGILTAATCATKSREECSSPRKNEPEWRQ